MIPRIVIATTIAAASRLTLAAGEAAQPLPVLSTVVSLLVVLAAIGVAAFVVKRLGRGGAPDARLMRVVGQMPLGAREKISIVEFDDQWLVLGVTAQQVTLLAQTARKEGAAPAPQAASFSRLFDMARGRHETR